MVTKVNNFVLHIYLKVTERVALKCSYHTKKIIIMWGDECVKLTLLWWSLGNIYMCQIMMFTP